jgi:hypothetical protein
LAQVTRRDNFVFTDDALQRIVQQAQGIPRTLNNLCTHALLTGVRAQQRPITATLADSVIIACTAPPPRLRWQRRLAVGASLGLVASLLWGVLWQELSSRHPLFPTSIQAQALRRTAVGSPAAQVQTSAQSASTAGAEHNGNTHGALPPRLEAPSAQSGAHIRHNAPEKPRAAGVRRPRHAGRRQAASPRASRQPLPQRYAESRQHEATRHTVRAVVSPDHTPDVKWPWNQHITYASEP